MIWTLIGIISFLVSIIGIFVKCRKHYKLVCIDINSNINNYNCFGIENIFNYYNIPCVYSSPPVENTLPLLREALQKSLNIFIKHKWKYTITIVILSFIGKEIIDVAVYPYKPNSFRLS